MLGRILPGELTRQSRIASVAFWAIVVMLSGALPGAAEDTVYLKNKDENEPTTKIVGTVIDYTGKDVQIRVGDAQRNYPSARVLKIESTYHPEHQAALTAIDQGQFDQAIKQLSVANSQEPRLWMRRRMLYELIQCYQATEQGSRAGETFLLLMSSDPTTPYFACIPLAWTASEAVSKTAAQTWFARHDLPASVLLGASHLLATDERPVATRALEKLAKSDDPQVASLAQTQLWRLAFRIQSEELDRWRQKLETLPEPLRAGPCFLFGTALLGEQRYEEAALVLMRVPILYEQQRDLSAASLVAAGDALLALGRDDQAVSLWREVLRKHPQTQWKADAELRLERTTK